MIALASGAIYLTLRPPLFDNDGYAYRLYALLPSRYYNVNPQHLLWNSIQILLAQAAQFVGHPTTIPFQVFGIGVDCLVLFFLYILLLECSGDVMISVAGETLVAFSPWFWYQGFQNRPYPLIFLSLILYLRSWRAQNGNPPLGWRLTAAALLLTFAILLQEAMILLVPVGALVLLAYGPMSWRQRLLRSLLWGGSILVLVLCAYLGYARFLGIHNIEGFFDWTRAYLETVHSFQVQWPASLAKATIGVVGSVLQTEKINILLGDNLSARAILLVYSSLALATVGAFALLFSHSSTARRRFARLIRKNALFAVSLLSILAWSAFVFAYGAANPHFWLLNLFPALVCSAMLFNPQGMMSRVLVLGMVLLLSGWNVYFNHHNDDVLSRNFPEPLLSSIREHVGPRDVFIVLGTDQWYGGMDYQLLFVCLKNAPENPGLGITTDFVLRTPDSQSWEAKLRDRIDSTLNSGGRVFVARHVFDPTEYRDLSRANDPFAEFTDTRYSRIDGETLYRRVRNLFDQYSLSETDFRLGYDRFWSVGRRNDGSPAHANGTTRRHAVDGN